MQRNLLTVTGRESSRPTGVVRAIRSLRLGTVAAVLVAMSFVLVLLPSPAEALPAVPEYLAYIDASSAPTTWFTGRSQTFTVQVTNDGNRTWNNTGSHPFRVGAHFANTGGGFGNNHWYTDVRKGFAAPVLPGATVPVQFTLTAPNITGSMVLEFQVVREGVMWIEVAAAKSITVQSADYMAQYDLAAIPTTWRAGETKTFPVTVKNIGDKQWDAGGPTPMLLGFHFMFMNAWLDDWRIPLATNVAPGGSTTRWVTVNAPASWSPWYHADRIQVRMVRAGVFVPQFADKPVTVNP